MKTINNILQELGFDTRGEKIIGIGVRKKGIGVGRFFILVLPLLYSCSSLPRSQPSQQVLEADNLYRLGRKMSLQGDYDVALKSYRLALDRYSLIDHLEGIILTKIAVIGVQARFEDNETVSESINHLNSLIESSAPQYTDNLLLVEVERAFLSNDYDGVIVLTEKITTKDVLVKSQLVCYRLMTLISQNQSAEDEYRNLRKMLKQLKRAYRRRKLDEINIYSYVNYVMGYYSIHNERWDRAIGYLSISLEADRINDYSVGIAQNLYHLGIAYRNKDNYEQAVSYMNRSLRVFELLDDRERINMIMDKLSIWNHHTN